MTPVLMCVALLVAVGVPAYAGHARGRTYGAFTTVLLALALPGNLALDLRLGGLAGPGGDPLVALVFLYGFLAIGTHLVSLVRARLRGPWMRYGVSLPGMAFLALGPLAGLWLLALLPIRGVLALGGAGSLLAGLRWLDLVPVAVVGMSLATSLRLPREIVRIRLGGPEPEQLERLPVERRRGRPTGGGQAPPSGGTHSEAKPSEVGQTGQTLRVVQITDPHLGPFQPVDRLAGRIRELLAQEPDLVLLTGDFLTMESNGTPGALARALAPLQAASGRCFAVFGNHDHEAPQEVERALQANGVTLLVDEEVQIATRVGTVQIVGADWYREGRGPRIQALLRRFPRRPGELRLLLLHDPSGFRFVPKGEVDLTLSGHTHGGQVGLVSLGLEWTVLSRSRWPDHGLFGHGPNRLYVHRGTGFYGFPLRIGVPGEASLLEVELGAVAR